MLSVWKMLLHVPVVLPRPGCGGSTRVPLLASLTGRLRELAGCRQGGCKAKLSVGYFL